MFCKQQRHPSISEKDGSDVAAWIALNKAAWCVPFCCPSHIGALQELCQILAEQEQTPEVQPLHPSWPEHRLLCTPS